MTVQKEGEKKEKKGLLQLQYKTLKRITYLLSKPSITNREVYEVTQEFFKELLQLEYECTHDEVIEELHHVYIDTKLRNEVESFLRHVGKIEYSTYSFSQKELQDMLGELKIMLKQLIHHHKKQKMFFGLFKKNVDDEKEEELAFKRLEEDIKEEEEKEEKKTAQQLMKEIPLILQAKDKETAAELYKEASEHYERLTKEDQKEVYAKLLQAYTHVKNI